MGTDKEQEAAKAAKQEAAKAAKQEAAKAPSRVYPPKGLKVTPSATTTDGETNISTFSMLVGGVAAVVMQCPTSKNKDFPEIADRVYKVTEVAPGLESHFEIDSVPAGMKSTTGDGKNLAGRSARLTKVALTQELNRAMSGEKGWRPEGWTPPPAKKKPAKKAKAKEKPAKDKAAKAKATKGSKGK